MSRSTPVHLVYPERTPGEQLPPCSPHCVPSAAILEPLGLDGRTPHLWLHLGPIGRHQTPLTVHGNPSPDLLAARIFGGGGVRGCDGTLTASGLVSTWSHHRRHEGYALDLLALLTRPAPRIARAARSLTLEQPDLGRVWIVAARAWNDPTGPWVEWGLDTPALAYCCPTRRAPTARELQVLARGVDLIEGRAGRTGRPPLAADRNVLEIAARAEAYHAKHPHLHWPVIAGRYGVDDRSLRRWRAALREQRAAPAPGGYS